MLPPWNYIQDTLFGAGWGEEEGKLRNCIDSIILYIFVYLYFF